MKAIFRYKSNRNTKHIKIINKKKLSMCNCLILKFLEDDKFFYHLIFYVNSICIKLKNY